MTIDKEKIVLYTSDYFCSDIKRQREIQMVLTSNSSLSFIEKIIILYEGWNDLSDELKIKHYSWLLTNSKIQVINWSKRQTYQDFYIHSKENYPEHTIVISNSDIYFDETLSRVKELKFTPNTLYTLTRWDRIEPKTDKSLWSPPYQNYADTNWSFDTYIFRHPLHMDPETINIEVGVPQCDTYLVKKLIVDNNIKIYNPMTDIRCWHQDFRQEENIQKDYASKEGYWRKPDYPVGTNKFENSIAGEYLGIRMQCTDVRPITQNRMILRKGLKVISFTLIENQESHTKGAIKNAEIALRLYPDWRCWFYIHEPSIPVEIIQELKTYPNVDIIWLDEVKLAKSMKFTAIDHKSVDVMICRDCIAQLSVREKLAVDEWLESDKMLHVMRDHPHHCSDPNGHMIMGGMFGMKKTCYWKGWDHIISSYKLKPDSWSTELDMLQQCVYPLFKRYDDIFVHATFNKFEKDAKDFPTGYEPEFYFVGETLFHDGSRNIDHVKNLIEALYEN